MSDPTPVDLSELQFMPDWLKEPSKKPQKSFSEKERRGTKNRKRQGQGNSQREFKGQSKWDRSKGHDRNRGERGKKRPRTAQIPRGVSAAINPGKESLKQIANQIKKTARAYSVFEIAKLMLAERDRYNISFCCESETEQELFSCSPDNSAWLSRPEAVTNLLTTEAFSQFYNEENIEVDPPKGNYSSVAVCGISGTLIAPPNHHSYQTEIARLHRQRFANMPIEKFKSRIRVEQDEETIESWKKEQSVQKHYTYKSPSDEETNLTFKTREEAEKHFLEQHADEFISISKEVKVPGGIVGKKLSPPLFTLLKQASDHVKKHPASLIHSLCTMLGEEGLKFFKRGKKIFACITRPKPLSEDSTLSEPIRAIVTFIRENKRVTAEAILNELAPFTKSKEQKSAKVITASDENADSETDIATSETDENKSPDKDSKDLDLSPEQIKVLQDLHWLLHEGAVIAFGDGKIELASARKPKITEEKKSSAKETPNAKEEEINDSDVNTPEQ